MSNFSKHNSSIASFILHVAKDKQNIFPFQQIEQYAKSNECTFQKLSNIFDSYFQRFKRTFENLKQIIILLSIRLAKIQLKDQQKSLNSQNQTKSLIDSLHFIQDLITTKMVFVCLAATSKNQQKQIIFQHFFYFQKFVHILVPKLLQFRMDSLIQDLIYNCNKINRQKPFISINFIAEFIFIQTVIQYLTHQSMEMFQKFILNVTIQKKKYFFHLFWDKQQQTKILNFKELAYLRLNIESQKRKFLQIKNSKSISCKDQNNMELQDNWISQAYTNGPREHIFERMEGLENGLQIYKFLFQLQVFASSPKIEELDMMIQNQEFLQYFSRFLMGQQLIEKEKGEDIKRQQIRNEAVQNLGKMMKIFQGVKGPYRELVKSQLSKMMQQEEQDADEGKD